MNSTWFNKSIFQNIVFINYMITKKQMLAKSSTKPNTMTFDFIFNYLFIENINYSF